MPTGSDAVRAEGIGAIVVFGVSGAGKTTIARRLAAELDASFVDADDHHDAVRIAQMAAGIPLEDEDRWGWLERLREVIAESASEGRAVVMACSALKRSYRDVLRGAGVPVTFVGLGISRATAKRRMLERHAHFMPVSMLASQAAAYEELAEQERAAGSFSVDADQPVEAVVAEVLRRLMSRAD